MRLCLIDYSSGPLLLPVTQAAMNVRHMTQTTLVSTHSCYIYAIYFEVVNITAEVCELIGHYIPQKSMDVITSMP